MPSFTSQRGLYVEHGGSGDLALILIHGMGCSASTWDRLLPIVNERWKGRWYAPDLRGHGRSLREGPFGVAMQAADIAALMQEIGAPNATLLGHSYGGAIAALLGTGWYGVRPERVVSVGAKLVWTAEEIAGTLAVAAKPQRGFATREEAVERALKVAGMVGLIAPDAAAAASLVRQADGQWFMAFDTRALGGVGPDIEGLFHLCGVPKRVAAGESDPMAFPEAMRRVDPASVLISGAGHNPHWEQPDAVWRFFVQG